MYKQQKQAQQAGASQPPRLPPLSTLFPFSVGGDDAAGTRDRMVERYRRADRRRPFRGAPVSRQKWGTTTTHFWLKLKPRLPGEAPRPTHEIYPGHRTWSRRAASRQSRTGVSGHLAPGVRRAWQVADIRYCLLSDTPRRCRAGGEGCSATTSQAVIYAN
jgi:hypothetical protein